MKQCVESKLQHCNDKFKKDEVKVFKDIMEYVCTPAGRQGKPGPIVYWEQDRGTISRMAQVL